MKTKIVFTALLAFLFFQTCFGQKSIVKIQVGYGLPLTNSLISQSIQSNSSTASYTGVYGSYGSGLRIEAGYLRELSEHLYLEMNFTYLIGKSLHAEFNSPTTTQSQTIGSHFYEISPMLRVRLGGNKVKPYAAIGPVVGFGDLTASNTSSSSGTINASDIQRKYSGSVAFGGKSAVGAELTQGKFIFYAQLTLIAMSYSPSQSEYTKYTLNGTDQLSQMTVSQKKTVYKTSLTLTQNPPDPNQPSEALKFYLPFSSISLNAGVMFKF